MRILVPIKRVVDHNVKVKVRPDGSGVDLDNVKMSMNPFDEIAVEEAVRLKEENSDSEIVVASIGDSKAAETLRTALAMGADRGILVRDMQGPSIEPLAVAKVLSKLVSKEAPKLVILGKQAIDNDMNATGQMLAALLGWGQATFASKLEVTAHSASVTREIDGGLQSIAVKLPAVVTTDLRMNEPRFASLPNIMKAKKKRIDELSIKDLGVDVSPRLTVLQTEEPQRRPTGKIVGTVRELVAELKSGGHIQ